MLTKPTEVPFRFIPAYAGNSSPLLIVCPTKNGSSPLTRGTHLIDPIVNTLCRFIPAYAGNSVNGTLQSQGQTVHPRLRGELLGYVQNLTFLFGSSPLTRGTRCSGCLIPSVSRFIPAYAGNSNLTNTPINALPVHPRLRGELSFVAASNTLNDGSSPLTRGTHLNKA